jgi:hypothetical protein
MGLTRFNYVRSMMFQSTTKFLSDMRWVLRSLLFVTDKFRDLSLQEPELPEVAGSGNGRLSPALVRVDLINEAQLRHESDVLGEVDLDSLGDNIDHNQVGSPTTTDPIYQLPLEFDFGCGREVYMVGQGEKPTEKIAKEIA